MSIASEITRLQGVKSDILASIADKGVTVPVGSALADCPSLIASITGGGFDIDSIVNIVPIDKIVVVDSNGYIGYDITQYFEWVGAAHYYNYAILAESEDFSQSGLGQVTFYTPAGDIIGGRTYNTVLIGGQTWLAENLDFKFSGCTIGQGASSSEPRANYYNNDETTYGVNGNKYGLLYNWIAVKYLEDHKAELIPGWHVPTSAEWNALATAVGGSGVAGTKLKSTTGWSSGNGDGSYGFAAFPAGGQYSGFFGDLGSLARFWTATERSSSDADGRYFSTGASMYSSNDTKTYAYSVRLVKDYQ